MVEYPLKVYIPFILFAQPFGLGMVTTQDSGPWAVALGVYLLTGGFNAVGYGPIAYRARLIEIVGLFLLIAIGAFVTALACGLLVSGSLDGLFSARPANPS